MKTDANVVNVVTVAAETLLPLEGAGLSTGSFQDTKQRFTRSRRGAAVTSLFGSEQQILHLDLEVRVEIKPLVKTDPKTTICIRSIFASCLNPLGMFRLFQPDLKRRSTLTQLLFLC